MANFCAKESELLIRVLVAMGPELTVDKLGNSSGFLMSALVDVPPISRGVDCTTILELFESGGLDPTRRPTRPLLSLERGASVNSNSSVRACLVAAFPKDWL